MARFLTRVATVVAILSLTLGALLTTPQSAEAAWTPNAHECSFLSKINEYRKANGLGALRLSRSLGAAADNHSAYMAKSDDIDHTLSGASLSWSQNIRNYGYPTEYAIGENVLAGRQSAAGALSLWKSSPGHNANMLNKSWKAIGIGRVYYADGRYDFYWTTTFGSGTHLTVSC